MRSDRYNMNSNLKFGRSKHGRALQIVECWWLRLNFSLAMDVVNPNSSNFTPFFSSSFESNNIYSFKNRIKLINLANYPITLLIKSLLLNWLISGSISEFN